MIRVSVRFEFSKNDQSGLELAIHENQVEAMADLLEVDDRRHAILQLINENLEFPEVLAALSSPGVLPCVISPEAD